jgi:hypothetical protein
MSSVAIPVPVENGTGVPVVWRGGWGTVWCVAKALGVGFDSGTVTLQVSYDGGMTWLTAKDSLGDNVAFAANGHSTVFAYGGSPRLRASLGGSSGATDVSLSIHYGYAVTQPEPPFTE